MGSRQFVDPDSAFPAYLKLAWKLDRSWMRDAACTGTPEAARRYWDAEPEGKGSKPAEARIARAFCRRCPAQWDCVTFAIEAKMNHCTWAVHAHDRQLLASQDDWKQRVEGARAASVPVALLMRTLREAKRYELGDSRIQFPSCQA